MIRTAVAVLLALAITSSADVLAHETFRIIGTITKVTAEKMDVKNKDGITKSMELTRRTVIRRLKEKQELPASVLQVGQSVVVDAFNPYDPDSGDDSQLEALDIRIVPALPKDR